jgi:hypothetical protein
MPFVENLRNYRSLSIVGLEKNTGKTVCLNYLLGRLHQLGISTAVTSIGVDGEQVDSVYATAKPEITLYEGMQFITSHKHYLQRRLVSRILAVDERRTALGQLVTAQVLCVSERSSVNDSKMEYPSSCGGYRILGYRIIGIECQGFEHLSPFIRQRRQCLGAEPK